MVKTIGVLLVAAAVIGLGFLIWGEVYKDYQWENTVLSNWNLSDKSSTIEAKAGYIRAFVDALKNNDLADNDALIFKTPDNSCEKNIDAVVTLQKRLEEISGMSLSSFEYQQAIQQITAQEQGEANAMLATLKGCWTKTHWYILWNPLIILLWICLIIGAGAVGFVSLVN